MDRITGRSMFDKYYSRIQGLLFEGYTIKEAFDYVCKYFELYTSYSNFWRYVKARRLDWFMPEKWEDCKVLVDDDNESAMCKNTECQYYRRNVECHAAQGCGGYSD